MTKEDTLNQIAMQVRFHTISGKSFPDTIDAIEVKMDEYAQSMSIAFAEWVRDNKYVWHESIKKWIAAWEGYSQYTTEQLYELFTQYQSTIKYESK